MDEALIGHARCSTDERDLTTQRQALHALGVPPDRVYIDHGISGTKRERPGLDQALAAVRTGDTLVLRSSTDLLDQFPMLETSVTRLPSGSGRRLSEAANIQASIATPLIALVRTFTSS